jgi:hypothetical protein
MANLQERMIRAAKLDVELYREVAADSTATGQATAIVAISGIAAGLGSMEGVAGVVWVGKIAILGLAGWYALAYLVYFVGVKFVPEPRTDATPQQLLRAIGFASTPGVLRILVAVPELGPLAFSVAQIWMLVALVIAVRQALKYDSTWRAIGVCVLSSLLQGMLLLSIAPLFFDLPES